jgi:hypothetical protein
MVGMADDAKNKLLYCQWYNLMADTDGAVLTPGCTLAKIGQYIFNCGNYSIFQLP